MVVQAQVDPAATPVAVALVQAGVLELHVRGSTIDHLEEADRLVFDLDPGPGMDWKDIVAAARDVLQPLATATGASADAWLYYGLALRSLGASSFGVRSVAFGPGT